MDNRSLDPPKWLIDEFESDDESKWPTKPDALKENETYYSYGIKLPQSKQADLPEIFDKVESLSFE